MDQVSSWIVLIGLGVRVAYLSLLFELGVGKLAVAPAMMQNDPMVRSRPGHWALTQVSLPP